MSDWRVVAMVTDAQEFKIEASSEEQALAIAEKSLTEHWGLTDYEIIDVELIPEPEMAEVLEFKR